MELDTVATNKEIEKQLLILGCSHAAGYEITGVEDSAENRELSFGNQLARMLNRKPYNVAMGGFSNGAILRTLLEWVNHHHDPEHNDLVVLLAWTEPFRIDIPVQETNNTYGSHHFPDKRFMANTLFTQMVGLHGAGLDDNIYSPYQPLLLHDRCEPYLDIMSITQMLTAQEFLNNRGIKYIMCNTMNHPTPSPHTASYLAALDKERYIDLLHPEKCFYFYYRSLGYENVKAQWWHHDERPHRLYAEYLYNWIQEKSLL